MGHVTKCPVSSCPGSAKIWENVPLLAPPILMGHTGYNRSTVYLVVVLLGHLTFSRTFVIVIRTHIWGIWKLSMYLFCKTKCRNSYNWSRKRFLDYNGESFLSVLSNFAINPKLLEKQPLVGSEMFTNILLKTSIYRSSTNTAQGQAISLKLKQSL